MFTSLYFYKVPVLNKEKFLKIQRQAALIYEKHGAIGDWTFGPDDLKAQYGCASFLSEIHLNENEELFFSPSIFESREIHNRIMKCVNEHPEISELYESIGKLIDLSKVVRGEFNRLV